MFRAADLAKLIAKVSASLAASYGELLDRLPDEATLNVDETGHPENRQKYWTWCFRAQLFTLFHIDKSRGSEVLIEALGTEFNGVLGCDYFSAYRKYMRKCGVRVQFCMAHLIRDVKFLLTLPSAADRAYGRRLRDMLGELFGVIHCREQMSRADFRNALETARRRVLWAGTTDVPRTRHAQNLAKRFRKHGEAYFRFMTTPGIGPTNNLAEQAIRFVVIDRRITQGTRSEKGRRWCERIWTVIATCAQQGLRGHSVLVGFRSSSSLRCFAAVAPAVRPLTGPSPPLLVDHLRGSAVTLCHRERLRYFFTTGNVAAHQSADRFRRL